MTNTTDGFSADLRENLALVNRRLESFSRYGNDLKPGQNILYALMHSGEPQCNSLSDNDAADQATNTIGVVQRDVARRRRVSPWCDCREGLQDARST